MNKKDLSVCVARWALFLEEFAYEIHYRPSMNMEHVNALSRNPLPEVLLINECNDSLLSRLRNAQNTDQDIVKLVENVKLNKAYHYVLRNHLLYREVDDELLLVVPKCMQSQIVQQAHERGHFGVNKTESLVRKDF